MKGFNYWMGGLIEGEGSFIICLNFKNECKGNLNFSPKFTISLKRNSGNVRALKLFKQKIGGGLFCEQKANHWQLTGKDKITIISTYELTSHKECLSLLNLLKNVPFYTEKKKDYLIWKRFVMLRNKYFIGIRTRYPKKVLLQFLKFKMQLDKKTKKGRRAKWHYYQVKKRINNIK